MPFPVTCPACGKSFSISDDVYDQKIKGRVVSVKCKQCQSAIRVDGTKGAPGKGGSGAMPSVAAPKPASPAEAESPPASARAAREPAETPPLAPAANEVLARAISATATPTEQRVLDIPPAAT